MAYFHSAAIALSILLLHLAGAVEAVNFLITFGDSYSQTGFDPSSTKPSASNPLGNPAYPGYTTSGGPNWIGYLVKENNASVIYSFNYASGGATVNASLVKPFQPTVKSFIDQVGQFSAGVATKPSYAQWTSQNTLFAVWLGVNDVGNSYSTLNETTLLGKIFDSYFSQVEILYKTGGRNFAFLGVPPINRSPTMLKQSTEAQQTEAAVIKQFNGILANRTSDFVASHDGAKAVVVDTQTPFTTALDHPSDYGASDATCYNSNGKTCLWYNDYHPGMAIHKLVANAVARAWNGSFFENTPVKAPGT